MTFTQNYLHPLLTDFYRQSDIDQPTKFLAAMIWGYEAPAGSRRAAYGPKRVSNMFYHIEVADKAINQVNIESYEKITESYKELKKKGVLPNCGPNFFTKHFYFLGLARNLVDCPVIFDKRVATALMKLAINPNNETILDMVDIDTSTKPLAYENFLKFIHKEAAKIGCHPDQLEYFLFNY